MSIAKLAWVSVAAVLLVTGMAVARAVPDKTVQITEKGFVPDKLEIIVHQTVAFQNSSQKDHTLTSEKPVGKSNQEKDETGFDSGVIKAGTTWEHMFSKVGTFKIYCKEHPACSGTIVVNPAK